MDELLKKYYNEIVVPTIQISELSVEIKLLERIKAILERSESKETAINMLKIFIEADLEEMKNKTDALKNK